MQVGTPLLHQQVLRDFFHVFFLFFLFHIFCLYSFTVRLLVTNSSSSFKALVQSLGRAVLCMLAPLSCTSKCCKTSSMSSCSLDKPWSQSFRGCLKLKKSNSTRLLPCLLVVWTGLGVYDENIRNCFESEENRPFLGSLGCLG